MNEFTSCTSAGSICLARSAGPTVKHVQCCQTDQQRPSPDISQLHPTLQPQWDHVKNVHLGDIVIKRHSNRKVFWNCPQGTCDDPHQWEASVSSRTSSVQNTKTAATGCPFCAGTRVCKSSSLAAKFPDIAKAWDYAKNQNTPEDYTAYSNHRAHWECPNCSYEWEANISNRTMRGEGCLKCYRARQGKGARRSYPTFAESNHELLAEWDYEQNEQQDISPQKITLRSSRRVGWICRNCCLGHLHRWSAAPANRTKPSFNQGCPYCSGVAVCKCNSLQTVFPAIAEDWDHEQNEGGPDEVTSRSNKLVWWRNTDRGSWQQKINSRTNSCLYLESRKCARDA